MKTKNIFLVTIALIWTLFWVSATYAAAVVPLSSGVKNQFYSLEWCSPQYQRLQDNWSRECRTGYFQNISGVAKVTYNGQSFPTGNVSPNISGLTSTRTSNSNLQTVSEVVSLFNSSTSGAFAIEGEWVLTIRAYITDYADNTSFYKVSYKVDKTAPQLSLTNMNENTDYTYYGGRVNASTIVTKNDSVGDSSSGDTYTNPLISGYAGSNGALPRASHTRTNLHAFYFQNNLSGLGANSPFNIVTSQSDNYNGYLKPSVTTPLTDGYNGTLVSGEKHFELLTSDGISQWKGSDLSVGLSTLKLVSNDTNTQKYYRLRLYDTTVDSGDLIDSGNYSETAFYAVRDNVSPNMGGNSLAGTDTTKAMETILQFPDNDTVYDKTAYANGYTPPSGGVSRFLAASLAEPISYKLGDIGITGNGQTTGANTSYNLFNAGLDTTNLKVNIEDANTPGSFPTFTTFSERFLNQGSNTKHFNKVDNSLVTNSTYRKYGVQFQSSSTNGICDLVGNCIKPTLAFRVVANALSNATSTVSVSSVASAVAGKIIANGSDKYRLSYSLRDAHGNKVVPVQSIENANATIKTVATTLNFQNGLGEDQRANTGSGTKHVAVANLETPDTPIFSEAINADGSVHMQESSSANPNGDYHVSLASKVPTKGLYPYLSDSAVLQVASIINRADLTSADGESTYPKSGTRMGYFASTPVTAGNTQIFTSPNTGNIGEIGGFNNINLNEADYGKVTFDNTNNTFANLANRRVNLEFASPLIYGLGGMRVLIDGQYSQHYKKLYTIDTAIASYNIYEKNLVAYNTDKDEQPGVLDYAIRAEGSSLSVIINDGAHYTSDNNLGLFHGLNNSIMKLLDIKNASGSGFSAELQMSSLPSRVYDNTKLRTGFVSALTYAIGWDTIILPSVARNIKDTSGNTLGQYDMARNYFSDTYTLKTGGNITFTPMISGIAITGLTNKYNPLTTDTGGTKANVNVGEELTRYSLITSIKKNVSLLSAGFKPSDDVSGSKRWCNGLEINQAFIDNIANSPANICTQVINGETISFIDGNATINCGLSTDCHVYSKRSIIVKNGSLAIKSNITSLDSTGTQTAGQFFIGTMNEAGLTNITIDGNTPNITDASKKGWLFIDPKITNIDAFLFAQGPMVSYSETEGKLYTKTLTTERKLRNQLHIMGSLLTLNNIAWSRKTPAECPYIVDNCTDDTAQMFDLIYLRRFALQPLSIFTGLLSDNNTIVPYHPDGPAIAKKSGGLTSSTITPASPQELRHITDPDYRPYPMLIERDTRWNTNPSELLKINN